MKFHQIRIQYETGRVFEIFGILQFLISIWRHLPNSRRESQLLSIISFQDLKNRYFIKILSFHVQYDCFH